MGRPARGVRGMDLAAGDFIVGAEVIGEEGLILSISDNGYGKRTKLTDYRLTNRGVKGVINMKTTKKTGKVVGDPFGEGRFRVDDRHPRRQDDSHRFGRNPPGRPVDPGRASGAHGRERPGGRRLPDPGSRREDPTTTRRT